MKKYIRIWVTKKRMTNKIRSVCRPLIKDRENGLRNGGFGWVLDRFLVFGFLEESSEKGSRRISTGNRVTSCTFVYLGEF
jgi:hypothetical protein